MKNSINKLKNFVHGINKIDDMIAYSRNEALKYYEDIKNNVHYFKVKKFDELAKKHLKK